MKVILNLIQCRKVFLFCILFMTNFAYAAVEIKYNVSTKYPDPKQEYYIALLKLVLEESKHKYGAYDLVPISYEVSQSRTSMMVQRGYDVDVTWRMTSPELEDSLRAIYIPLVKGLMGYRIFIIRKGEQNRFPKNITEQELFTMIAGQGYDWPDTKILKHNNVNVMEGSEHKLLQMLAKNRFDYFPRAIHEPWFEISENGPYEIEKNILFKYFSPIYFFVQKENKNLHERISYGLSRVIKNGKFETLFQQHPVTSNILSLGNISGRKAFVFENPFLTDKTRALMNDQYLWLNIDQTNN